VCFNWVWMVQLTQHCLYMDSLGYMKHSYMTRNLCTEQDKQKKSALCTPCTALNWGVCKFVGSTMQWTFEHLFQLLFSKHYSNSSNTLDMLELHATLLTPDLARYSCVHACKLCKKSDFTLFGPKQNLVLYSCLCSSTRMTSKCTLRYPIMKISLAASASEQPVKESEARKKTYHKWVEQYDRECQVVTWLDCETHLH